MASDKYKVYHLSYSCNIKKSLMTSFVYFTPQSCYTSTTGCHSPLNAN